MVIPMVIKVISGIMVKVRRVVEDFDFPRLDTSLLRNRIHYFANRQGLNSSTMTKKSQSSNIVILFGTLWLESTGPSPCGFESEPQKPHCCPGQAKIGPGLWQGLRRMDGHLLSKPAINPHTVFFFFEDRFVYDIKYGHAVMAIPLSLYLSSYSATTIATSATHKSVSIYRHIDTQSQTGRLNTHTDGASGVLHYVPASCGCGVDV